MALDFSGFEDLGFTAGVLNYQYQLEVSLMQCVAE